MAIQVKKIDQPKKQHTFPCVLENIEQGNAGCKGLIVFFYKTNDERIMGVVIDEGNSPWYPGYYASNWSVNSSPHRWVPVDIQITHGDLK